MRKNFATIALITATAFTATACGQAANVSTTAIEVPTLWASSDHSAGGLELATVDVSGDSTPGWSVNLATEEAHGAGSQWLAASGQAATIATLYAGLDPASLSIAFDVTGPIDGPSAGGILTAASLAALLGDHLKPGVTMTGTIEADGAIGRVGGVETKAAAAAKAGFNVMLVPVGQTPVVIPTGLSVVEVKDLPEAYTLLTGVNLADGLGAPVVSPAVLAEGERQAQLLAGVDDMGAARQDALNDATSASQTWSSLQMEDVVALTVSANDALIRATVSGATEATMNDQMTSGHLAAIPAILALASRSATEASEAFAWSQRHPGDVMGTRAAAGTIARAHANVTLLTPALLAVAAQTPGRLANAGKAEAALRGYTAFEGQAASAAIAYIVDVDAANSASVEDIYELAILAGVIHKLSREDQPDTAGLAGALRGQVWALATWQAANSGLAALNEYSYGTSYGERNVSTVLIQRLASAASNKSRDPSMGLWVASWAPQDADAAALDLGVAATLSILAGTPQTTP